MMLYRYIITKLQILRDDCGNDCGNNSGIVAIGFLETKLAADAFNVDGTDSCCDLLLLFVSTTINEYPGVVVVGELLLLLSFECDLFLPVYPRQNHACMISKL